MNKWLRYFLMGLLALFAVLLLQITLQYLPMRDDVGFLRIKQQYLSITHWKIAFFVHVFTSFFALLAGFTQFAPQLLRQRPALHRWIGKVYVADILLLTGPAGFMMSLYANGGWPSRVAFTILSLLWMYFTYQALQAIRQRNIARHRDFMIRSYAMTLSAVTLRAWKYLLVLAFHPHPLDVYMLVAWMGWVPNLLVAEILINRTRKQKKTVSNSPPAIV